ncbi:MAG: hypothetical protein F6J98_01490 [Moorea sp. SIO4G2]|nr:hypothetical protein [Moorena sp. SIO4G2]
MGMYFRVGESKEHSFYCTYSRFDKVRFYLCDKFGGSWPSSENGHQAKWKDYNLDPNSWYWAVTSDNSDYNQESKPGLYALLSASDTEGEIPPGSCQQLALELRQLLAETKDSSPSVSPEDDDQTEEFLHTLVSECHYAYQQSLLLEWS